MGALTAKPYAFTVRPWELKGVESVDFLEAEGAHTRVEVRGNRLLRVLPRIDHALAQEWLSDVGRFGHDLLQFQRLRQPSLRPASLRLPKLREWSDLLQSLRSVLGVRSPAWAALVGSRTDLVTLEQLGVLAAGLGATDRLLLPGVARSDLDLQHRLFFSSPVVALESVDFCVLLGAQPRLEAPLLNIRLRRLAVSQRTRFVSALSPLINSNFSVAQLGVSPLGVISLVEGRGRLARLLARSRVPAVIIGGGCQQSFAAGLDCLVDSLEKRLARGVVLRLPESVVAVHAAYLGLGVATHSNFSPRKDSTVSLLHLVGGAAPRLLRSVVLLHQGSHGDQSLNSGRYFFPTLTGYEVAAPYLNGELRLQSTAVAVTGVVPEARAPGRLLRAFSALLNLVDCDGQSPMEGVVPLASLSEQLGLVGPSRTARFENVSPVPLRQWFHRADPLLKASRNLSLAAGLFARRRSNFRRSE